MSGARTSPNAADLLTEGRPFGQICSGDLDVCHTNVSPLRSAAAHAGSGGMWHVPAMLMSSSPQLPILGARISPKAADSPPFGQLYSKRLGVGGDVQGCKGWLDTLNIRMLGRLWLRVGRFASSCKHFKEYAALFHTNRLLSHVTCTNRHIPNVHSLCRAVGEAGVTCYRQRRCAAHAQALPVRTVDCPAPHHQAKTRLLFAPLPVQTISQQGIKIEAPVPSTPLRRCMYLQLERAPTLPGTPF
jgi:hypothetical protein